MANEKELEIILKAKNETKKAFDEVDKSLKETSNTTEKTKEASSGLWKEIVKGQAVYNIASKAIGAFSDFMKESITASIEAEKEMAQVKTNFENAGIAFDSVKVKLEAYSQSMIQLGFDDEETATSISKLTQITGNYDDAVKLNTLSMDLARAKNIGLNDATKILSQVMAGNTRVLKEYGIVLDDDATAGEALDAIQKKVKGSAESFANTTAGKLEVLKQQWANIKEEVGDRVSPAIGDLTTKIQDNMPAITNMMGNFGQAIAWVTGKVVDLANAWAVWTGTDVQKLDKSLKSNLEISANFYNAEMAKMGKQTSITAEDINNFDSALKKNFLAQYGKGVTEVASRNATLELSLKNITSASDNTSSSVSKLKETFDKLKETAKNTLTDIKDNLVKVKETISKLNTEKLNIEVDYQQNVANVNKNIATAFVEQQAKVTQLAKELNDTKSTLTDEELKDKQNALDKETRALDNYRETAIQYATEIQEATRFAGLTEFEQKIETYNQEKALLEKQYNEKVFAVNQEIALETDKQAQLLALEKQAEKDYQDILNNRVKMTESAINKMVDKYSAVNDTIKGVTSQKTVSDPIQDWINANTTMSFDEWSKLQGRASGGSVNRNTPYMVGEKGPELFVPKGNGLIVPNNKLGSNIINITVTGNQLLDRDSGKKIADAIFSELKLKANLI